jgi:nucleotide-binding universal stress UspA family protein
MEHPTVLVFVEFPDPNLPSTGFLEHLAYPDAELLGFYQLDDEEPVEEVRAEHEDSFRAELAKQAEQFEKRGIRTEYDLLFEHDRVEARQRISEREAVDAILLPGEANTLGKVLIASRDLRNAEDKASNILNIVDREDMIAVDLVHVADPDDPEGEETGEEVLRQMKSILTEKGVPDSRIHEKVRTGSDVAFELSQAARGYDLIVLGETEQDAGDKIFGPVSDYILDDRDVPVLIVR